MEILMPNQTFLQQLQTQLSKIKEQGLYKNERVITTPQGADIAVQSGEHVLNFCANNYLGLANHPALVEAAKKAAEEYGYGMASVRFICGTQTVHKTLENRIAKFLKMDDTILYSSYFSLNQSYNNFTVLRVIGHNSLLITNCSLLLRIFF